MQLLFADESGTAPQRPGRQRYFTVGSVIIPEDQWTGVEVGLSRIKSSFGVRGEIKWRYFAPHNNDSENTILHLGPSERDELRTRLYRLITSRKSIKAIACVVSVPAAFALPRVNDDDDIYNAAYKPLTERFQYYLQDLSRTIGKQENGIIVLDHRGPKDDRRIRDLHMGLLNAKGRFVSNYKNLIEGLFIAPSHHSVGIQLADMFAGAVQRSFEHGDNRWLGAVWPAVRKDPKGRADGWGIVRIPKRTFHLGRGG